MIVNGRLDRTDQFTGCVLAVHAGYWGVIESRVIERTAVIGVHPDPVHLPMLVDLFFADHRDVVLYLASNQAGIAPDARRQINRHSPFVALISIFIRIVEGLKWGMSIDRK